MDYLLVISPPWSMARKVIEIKEFFRQRYQCEKAAGLYPHITLASFSRKEALEALVVDALENFAASVVPMKLRVNGFGHFPMHTIYLKLENARPVGDLVKRLKARFTRLFGDNKAPHFPGRPHMTIARQMSLEQYLRALKEWEAQSFQGEFLVQSMKLLKREDHTKSYDVVKEVFFRGKGLQHMQGLLFSG